LSEIPDITSPRKLNSLFQSYGLQPRRHLGQNFLIDANIVRKIIAAARVEEGDAVIEVGPGAGALTVNLARTGANLMVLEIDRGLIRLLKDLLRPWPEVEIIEQDVLKVDWKELIRRTITASGGIKLISNLPYNISAPFMYALFKDNFPFTVGLLMFQKEVAHRLIAAPGDNDYGALSVICGYYTEGIKLFDVSKNVFWPRPKVGSAVLRLQPRERELTGQEEGLFWEIVRGFFQQRRKTVLNSMSRLFPFSRNRLTDLLEKAVVFPGARPEELSVKQFAMLTRITYNYLSKYS